MLESPRLLSEWGWGPTAQTSPTTVAVVPTHPSDGACPSRGFLLPGLGPSLARPPRCRRHQHQLSRQPEPTGRSPAPKQHDFKSFVPDKVVAVASSPVKKKSPNPLKCNQASHKQLRSQHLHSQNSRPTSCGRGGGS